MDRVSGTCHFLSYPNSPEYTNPDGAGKRTQFLNGPIYWSAATGAHPVVNSFLNRWQLNGYEAGRLKYPTTDEIVLPDGGRRQEFQQGVIYVAFQNAVGSALINGPLRDKYNTVGGLTPGASFLGYPTEDQKGLPDGQGQMDRFQNGVIYWSPATGAHYVAGPTYGVWFNNGYEAGQYGYPISDPYGGPARPGAAIQDFQRDSITVWAYKVNPASGECTEPDPSGCSTAPYNTLEACREFLTNDDDEELVKSSDIILQFQDVNKSHLVCRDYRAHIIPGHFQTDENGRPDITLLDELNFITCLKRAIERGTDWPEARAAHGYQTKNTTGVRGRVALDRNWKITSAFPSNDDQKDWGGCVRDSG